MKISKIKMAISGLLMALGGMAEAKTITTKVLKVTGERVIVSTFEAGTVQKGEYLKMGDNCDLEVVRSGATKLILDTDLCESKNKIRAGNMIRVVSQRRQAEPAFDAPAANRTRTEKVSRTENFTGEIVKGWRASFAIPNLKGEFKMTENGFGDSVTRKEDADAKIQIGVGYSDIGLNRVGPLANLNLTTFDESAHAMRLEGSAAYGFNPQLYGFAGLNMNKYTKGPSIIKDLKTDFGYQLGVGLQASSQLGFELKYVNTKNNGDISTDDGFGNTTKIDLDLEMKGIELGIVSTF